MKARTLGQSCFGSLRVFPHEFVRDEAESFLSLCKTQRPIGPYVRGNAYRPGGSLRPQTPQKRKKEMRKIDRHSDQPAPCNSHIMELLITYPKKKAPEIKIHLPTICTPKNHTFDQG